MLGIAHFGTVGELTRLLYRPRLGHVKPHYDTLQMKERWAVQMAQQAAEEQKKKQSAKEGDRAPLKSTELERRERAETRAKQYMERTKEGRKAKTQESRDRPAVEQLQKGEEDQSTPELLDQSTPELLMQVRQAGSPTYCTCQKPYYPREYYIQCSACQGWFHPKCLGQTKAECEAQRQAEEWLCGRPGCNQERAKEKEKEE